MSLVQTENLLLFFSYARQDKGLRDKLEEHLSNLKYRELISTWHIREIGAFVDIALGIERVVREEAAKSTQVYQPGQPQGPYGQPQPPYSAPQPPYSAPYQQPGYGYPPSPGYLPQRRRKGVLVSLTFVSLSLLLSIVVAGTLFTLFTFHTPSCPSGPPCTGNP